MHGPSLSAACYAAFTVSGQTKGTVNLLMAAMGPNVAGVIGNAVAAGVFLALLR